MNVQIESIRPEYHEGHGIYRFKVTVAVDGQSQRGFYTDPEKLLSFQQFRAEVANHTGYLLEAQVGTDWESELTRLWERPKPKS